MFKQARNNGSSTTTEDGPIRDRHVRTDHGITSLSDNYSSSIPSSSCIESATRALDIQAETALKKYKNLGKKAEKAVEFEKASPGYRQGVVNFADKIRKALTLWIHSLGPTFDSLRARIDKEIEEEGPYNLDDFSPLDKETMELLNQVNEALNDDEYSEEDKKTIQLLDKVNKLTKSINTVTEEELDPSSTIESKIR